MRRTPSTSQNRHDESQPVLDEAREPDRDDEEQADREQRARATTVADPHAAARSASSSSGSCALAEMPSALKPIASDSPSATTPRTIGSRSSAVALEDRGRAGTIWTSISPCGALLRVEPPRSSCSGSGLRTATAQSRRRASSRPRGRPGRPRARRAGPSAAPSGRRGRGGGHCGGRRSARRRRAWRRGAGSARRGRRCRRASAGPCRTGGSWSRSRRGSRAGSSAS